MKLKKDLYIKMASKCCPLCYEIFKDLILLSCTHSVCKDCIQTWKSKGSKECSACRRRSSKEHPPVNLALKNLCESFIQETRSERSSSVCHHHNEKLKLFCLLSRLHTTTTNFVLSMKLLKKIRSDEILTWRPEIL